MNKIVMPGRLMALAIMLAAILFLYGAAMYELQISDQETYTAKATGNYTTTTTVSAARGNVMDRNGTMLISSRASYNIVLSRDEIVFSSDPNQIIRELIQVAGENNIQYTDTFPITASAPFEWQADMSSTQRGRLVAYFDFFSSLHDDEGNALEDPTQMAASDFIVWLKDHYGIDYTVPITEARQIIGIRYELEMRAISNISSYVFAEDVGTEFVAAVLERDFPGLSITTTTTREYHTTSAPHILGYTGKMNAEEYYSTYKAQDYPFDAVVGKSGVELAFEEYLHGTDGRISTTYNSDGVIINQTTIREAKAGDNVLISIDIGLQAEVETALSSLISQLNAQRTAGYDDNGKPMENGEIMQLAEGGAVVVLDVATCQVLAMASYPTYDPTTMFENYTYLSNDSLRPMFNRATQGIYNPGSTFKMVTALAGLTHGHITTETQISCEGRYREYSDYQPYCWVYPYYSQHANLNVIGALENSCNFFFYKLADEMGIMAIATTAEQFGFGRKTGIEIPEAEGIIANPTYKETALLTDWYAADNLLAAIGQGLNFFTPLQLANYCATLANTGVHKRVTILHQVMSPDYTDIVFESRPTVDHIISNEYGYISQLQMGMIRVASHGTAKDQLSTYAIEVAAKTGTVQSGGDTVNNGVFICYAPANNPEIAIAVLVEHGGSGAGIISVATDIMDYYFEGTTASTPVAPENQPVQ